MKSSNSVPSKNPTHVLPISPKWLQMYGDFVTKNQSAVTSIESTLRSIRFLIPGRFRDAELVSESLHCSIELLSLYHDILMLHSNTKLPTIPNMQSIHNRYTKHWSQRSRFYRQLALILSMIQYTKLLWEMLAKRKGDRARWRIIVALEMFEALCKLGLLRITKSRPSVIPPLPAREVIQDDSSSENEFDEFDDIKQHLAPKEYRLKRTGMSLPSLPYPTNISSYLLSRVVTADDIKLPSTLLNQLHGPAYLAELLHILQPVIYAIAMSRSKNKKSWQPWLLGISIEYLARHLRKVNLRTTPLEREQWGKRNRALLWWIMRGAFYENITKGILRRTSERLPNFVSSVLDEYLYLWDEYYFSTSSN